MTPSQFCKSTHSGLPWLLFLRRQATGSVHFWPFDGWEIPAGKSAIVEVYPALWSRSFASVTDRTPDQHNAYSVAEWLRRADLDGNLPEFLQPPSFAKREHSGPGRGVDSWGQVKDGLSLFVLQGVGRSAARINVHPRF